MGKQNLTKVKDLVQMGRKPFIHPRMEFVNMQFESLLHTGSGNAGVIGQEAGGTTGEPDPSKPDYTPWGD